MSAVDISGFTGSSSGLVDQGSTFAAGAASPNWAMALAVFQGLTSAYANVSEVRSAGYEVKSRASAYGHRARMLELDERAAERQAISILRQGQSEVGRVTLAGGQQRAQIEASAAARGVVGGVGSAAEVQLSERLVEAMDVYHIELGAVRAANAARTEGVRIGNQAAFDRVSAVNLRRSARAAAPEAALLGGLAGGAIDAMAIKNYRRA